MGTDGEATGVGIESGNALAMVGAGVGMFFETGGCCIGDKDGGIGRETRCSAGETDMILNGIRSMWGGGFICDSSQKATVPIMA